MITRTNSFTSLSQLSRLFCVIIALIAVFIFVDSARASRVDDQVGSCTDVLAVFARGSSSNQGDEFLEKPYEKNFRDKEPEAGRFFQRLEEGLKINYPHIDYKAISIHNIPNKYNSRGYPASGIFGILTINNAINAEITWWPLGDYQDSVRDGREEVVGYLKDEIQRCPDQQIVLGGFSQGAQVAGEAVFDLSATERQNIGTLALFGDPKFVSSDYSPLKFWQKPNLYPWKRGTASPKERGLADARVPYVPTDMEKKTLSWCFEDDFICTGYEGVGASIYRDLNVSKQTMSAGHQRYASFGIPQAADEALQLLAPKLYAVEKTKGGIDQAKGTAQPVPYQPTNKPIDFMFMINISYNTDDVINELRFDTATVLNPLNNFFSNTNFAVGDFNENSDYFGYIPRVNIRQNFSYYNPNDASPRLINTMYRQLAWGGLSGGGEDVPDPHILAIEQAAVKGTWRSDAVKNLVIITDRPIKETYTYDLCSQNLKTNLDQAAPVVCNTNNQSQTLPVSAYPEVCKQILQVLTQTDCDIPPSSPYYVKKITRTIQDALIVARSKGIAISVVIPHAVRYEPGSTAAVTEKQLENLATATGGLYLKYNVFNRASYSDMMWQILNHQPKTLRLAAYNLAELSQNWSESSFMPIKQLVTKVGVPTTLDVSQSNQTYDSYKWDFDNNGTWDEETLSPSTEHIFTETTTGGLITVAGFTNNTQQATLTLPIKVDSYEGPLDDPVSPTELPTDIKAIRKLDGSIYITWESPNSNTGIFFVGSSTGIPLISSPVAQQTIIIPDGGGLGSELQVWVVGESSVSSRMTVPIEQELIPVINDPTPVQEDPIPVVTIPDQPLIAQQPEPTNEPVLELLPEVTIVQALATTAIQPTTTVATQNIPPKTTNNPQQTAFTPQVAGLEIEKPTPQIATTAVKRNNLTEKNKQSPLFYWLLILLALIIILVGLLTLRRRRTN